MNHESEINSTIIKIDTTTILGVKYTATGTNENRLTVVNSEGDTVLNQAGLYADFEFTDFNEDGLKDIVIQRLSNVPGVTDLLLFDKTHGNFKSVKRFDEFPDPKPIRGTDYFYSYHRSGCADNFWDSDLFYIRNFEAFVVGNISGNECEGQKGIVVSKMTGGNKKTVQKFSLKILRSYRDGKWGFIADYWGKKYSEFTG